MKVVGLFLPVLFLLATPAMAVEYQGKNIDGKKLDAKAYYSQTGGVYNDQVRFKRDRATIYFADGSQTTIRVKQRVITDPNNIEGFGKLGQVPVNRIFSVGLNLDNNVVGSGQQSESLPLGNFFWRISLKQR